MCVYHCAVPPLIHIRVPDTKIMVSKGTHFFSNSGTADAPVTKHDLGGPAVLDNHEALGVEAVHVAACARRGCSTSRANEKKTECRGDTSVHGNDACRVVEEISVHTVTGDRRDDREPVRISRCHNCIKPSPEQVTRQLEDTDLPVEVGQTQHTHTHILNTLIRTRTHSQTHSYAHAHTHDTHTHTHTHTVPGCSPRQAVIRRTRACSPRCASGSAI
jgi:uncharacterized protein (DUF1499 family)